MRSCREARATIVASARRRASQGELLGLDRHLATCAACRDERAHWALLEALREYEPPALGPAAQSRILSRLQALPAGGRAALPIARPSRAPLFVGFALASLTAAAVITLAGGRGGRPAPPANPATTLATEGQPIAPREAGSLRFAGATVGYRRGVVLRLFASRRQIDLASGEIDVEVTPGGPRHFRVATAGFIVDVVGTRFVVSPAAVSTLHGRVRVLSLDGRELAVLTAGQTWRASGDLSGDAATPPVPRLAGSPGSSSGGAAPAPPLLLATPDEAHAGAALSPWPAAGPLPRAAGDSPTERPALAGGSHALARARSELAAGRIGSAREQLRLAASVALAAREQAVHDLLRADALLVAARRDEAAVACRSSTAAPDCATTTGEEATFSLARALSERGEPAAAAALQEYLARYPSGRFAAEARKLLAEP